MISRLEKKKRGQVYNLWKWVMRAGAINRVVNARDTWVKSHDTLPDFIVGLEVLFGREVEK